MARLHIRRASIYIVSSVLSHPDSWRLAVDKSTHSLFSLLSYEDFFKCHHDDKQCCESRGDQAGCCFCVFGHLNGTDRRAHKHTAITLTHSHSLALYPFQSHTLLIVSFPSRSLTTHHTAITGAGWISIVMCLVASHWL